MSNKSGYKLTKYCGRWKWELHKNGVVLATSGQDYSRKSDARRAFNRAASEMIELVAPPAPTFA